MPVVYVPHGHTWRQLRAFLKGIVNQTRPILPGNTVPGGYSVSRANLRAGALAVAVVMLHPEAANAAAFMVRETSANAVGMVSAGLGSRAEDASTVFNNPCRHPSRLQCFHRFLW